MEWNRMAWSENGMEWNEMEMEENKMEKNGNGNGMEMDINWKWNRPYAYDVTEGRPRVLGVKRGTVTCAIAKHAASGPTPACHTPGPARARALTERLRAPTLFQHNTCAQRDKS